MVRYAWGIDIGDGVLKAVRAAATRTGFAIDRALEIPYHDPFLSRKPAAVIDRRAAAALIQLASAAAIGGRDLVAVGFSSLHAVEGFLTPPKVGSDDMAKIVAFEVADRLALPAEGLDIQFVEQESRSPDAHRIQALVTVRREVDDFLNYLEEAGIAWDHLLLSSGALLHLLRLVQPGPGDFAVISPGLTSTVLLATRRNDFWAGTLSAALPLPPGEAAEMAPDKMRAAADALAAGMKDFFKGLFSEKDYVPRKVFVSGEGARIPGLLNALDFQLGLPVETLKPEPAVSIEPAACRELPRETVASMGKAIGLAVGALGASAQQLPVRKPIRSRRFARALPVLTALTLLLLLIAVGFEAAEKIRGAELAELDQRFESAVPRELSVEADLLAAETDALAADLARLSEAARKSWDALIPGRIISGFESPSRQGRYGEYHLVELILDFERPGTGTAAAVVAIRLSDAETVKADVAELFAAQVDEPSITGPHPSGEVQPPENLAPLVHYRITGNVKEDV